VLDLNTIITDISAMVSRLLGEDMKVKLHLTPSLGLVEVGIDAVKQLLTFKSHLVYRFLADC
jgi:hypothetical protein